MHLMGIFGKICCQIPIYEVDLKNIIDFEIQKGYKYGNPLHIRKLFSLRFWLVIFRLSVSQAFYRMSSKNWD